MVTAGLIVGGSALAGSGLNFLGGQSQSKAVRKAMEDYINYTQGQRNLFLNQPETGAIREKLNTYIGGNVGYSDDTLNTMKSGVYEDYGKSLADMTRLTGKAGAASTGVYTPGRADRTSRLLGENIAANRANAIRDITTKNADVALSNQRLAVSALPTYMPGLPATPTISPDVFANANAVAPAGSYFGPAITQAGSQYANLSIMSPIMEKLLTSQQNPYAALYAGNLMNGPAYSRMAPIPYFGSDYYANLSPTR